MTKKEGEMDSIFNDGPEEFLQKQLRNYIEHVNPELKNKAPTEKTEDHSVDESSETLSQQSEEDEDD